MDRLQTGDSLRISRLRKSFSGKPAVDGVDLEVDAGEIIGLLGPSGSGKSTIFNMIAGIVRPDAGAVILSGQDVTRAGIDTRARLGLGYVPQSPVLFPRLTAQDNLRIAIEASGATGPEALLERLCHTLALDGLNRTRLDRLSGGQRRRVEIAFALASQPRFLLLDEPFSGLDPLVAAQLSEVVAQLTRSGMGVIVTDHNVRHALKLVQRAYVLDEGRIIASGGAEQIVDSGEVRHRFLGTDFRL